MTALRCAVLAIALVAAGLVSLSALAAGPKRVFILVEPADTLPGAVQRPSSEMIVNTGTKLRITGKPGIEAAGKTFLVTVTPPDEGWDFDPRTEPECPGDPDPPAKTVGTKYFEKPVTLEAKVDEAGGFEAAYAPRIPGEYEIEAVDAEAAHKGEAKFIAATPELPDECKQAPEAEIAEAAAGLTDVVCDAMEALDARIQELPPMPGKDEFLKRFAEAKEQLKAAAPCGEAPSWVHGVGHVNAIHKAHPALRKPTQPLIKALDDWRTGAEEARKAAPKALAAVTSGNIACDQLDIVINGLKFVDFYLGLIVKPGEFLSDWGKENIPTKLFALIPAVGQTAAVKDGVELGWKGVTSYKPTFKGGKIKISAVGIDRLLAHQKIASGLSAYLLARVFEQFCQVFQGPITGEMAAEFRSRGKLWWRYKFTIGGQLVLRYPANAKGDKVALTGEFVGNATHIESWDNAIPELHPELAQGTVFRTLRIEPIVMDTIPYLYERNLGQTNSTAVPDFNPVKSTIDQGGLITQFVMTPAFFRIPVRGDFDGKSIRLDMQPAVVDFDDLRVKVVHIVLPVLSLWPDVVDYALPYKGAHFLILRAMNDGPVTFDVVKEGQAMKVTREFTRAKRASEAKGDYKLSIRACNPAC